MKEIVCPACGGLVEADDLDAVLELAREHCAVAHGYAVPEAHLLSAVEEQVE